MICPRCSTSFDAPFCPYCGWRPADAEPVQSPTSLFLSEAAFQQLSDWEFAQYVQNFSGYLSTLPPDAPGYAQAQQHAQLLQAENVRRSNEIAQAALEETSNQKVRLAWGIIMVLAMVGLAVSILLEWDLLFLVSLPFVVAAPIVIHKKSPKQRR